MTARQARMNPNRLGRAVLLLGLPLLMAQSASDCLPSPDPKTTANPLALDCVSGGTQLFIPIELTVALDRYPIAETGLNADTSLVARFPAEVFCAIADSGASTTDLESAAIGLIFDGVTPPGDESALHTAINLPIQGIDLVDACGGAYGSEITVDLGTVRSTPWLNGDWTLDFMVAPPSGMIILLKNIDLPGLPIPGPTVDFLSFCDPTDKSDPPNGTTDDPEDSPRLAADRDRDGIYETLAVAADQVQFGVQGHCVGHRCEDYNDCTIDTCDPRNYGRCSYENEPDGTACDFGGQSGVCNAGACVDANPTCTTGMCTKTISLGCTNNVTSDVSFLNWELSVDPTTIISGQSVDVAYDGIAEFPEPYLDAVQSVPGGVTSAWLVDVQSTVHVRAGSPDAADVALTNEPIPYICGFDPLAAVSCDPANDLASIPGARGNTDCVPTGNFNPCVQIISFPTSTDCSPGGLCESLGPEKQNQCDYNGFCITGDLMIPLQAEASSFTADASGKILFGWDDQSTGATLNPDGTWSLPPAVYADATGPNGMRINDAGLLVALECTMAVDANDPLYGVGVPDKASPTPDELLLNFDIQVP